MKKIFIQMRNDIKHNNLIIFILMIENVDMYN